MGVEEDESWRRRRKRKGKIKRNQPLVRSLTSFVEILQDEHSARGKEEMEFECKQRAARGRQTRTAIFRVDAGEKEGEQGREMEKREGVRGFWEGGSTLGSMSAILFNKDMQASPS